MKTVNMMVLAMGLVGCAETVPYKVWTHAMYENEQQKIAWFADGPDLVVSVENFTDFPHEFAIKCDGVDKEWKVKVPAHNFRAGVGQVLNVHALNNPCSIARVDGVRLASK